jgi:hypothetical protein
MWVDDVLQAFANDGTSTWWDLPEKLLAHFLQEEDSSLYRRGRFLVTGFPWMGNSRIVAPSVPNRVCLKIDC